ncbi:MICOS complex subunit MIC10 [Nonomuraea rhizosphaerae]|uniref:MICOS complex subunit MIC10 n=1 Tax=Nonomuraea rhizosphaerae TaxID=2665663 RepID=UPI001C5CF7B3|nr:MICOS complex subunit MIC10 [Nonomuraea rhizosphaerae]
MVTHGTTAGVRQWLRGGDAVIATALVMIAVQLVWKFGLVRRTYFRQDDFMFIASGLDNNLSWDYLMRVDHGHLVPGPFAVQWAMGRLGVYNDVLAHIVTIALLGAASLALLRLLSLLFGPRPAILVPLAFYCLTPMTISSLSWWTVVIETLPYQIALPMALASHVLYSRTGRFGHALAAAGWTLFAMAFFVKAPFILVLAVVLSLGWLGWRGRRRAWPLYALLLVAYAAVFFRQLLTSEQLTDDEAQPSLPGAGLAARFAWTLLSGSLVPTSLGGPLRWQPIGEDYATAAPPPALVWAGLGVAVLVVAASLLFRRRAWVAWLTLLGYFALADVVPVMIGRIKELGPDLSGFELRYISSTAMVTAIVVGLAFIPVAGEEHPWRSARLPRLRPLRHAWIPLTAAFTAGSVWSVTAYARLPLGENVRSYVETGRLALQRAPEKAVILDTHVPAKVVYPIFFHDYALNSSVLGPVAPHPVTWIRRLSGPLRNPLTFDPQGRLRPVGIDGLTIPQRDGCTKVGAREVRFPLPVRLPEGGWTAQVGYLNPSVTRLSVGLGAGRSAPVQADKGFGWTFATVEGGGRELVIRTEGGPDACVGEIRIGVPRPSADGAPSPLQPVS